jgi:hypothetical protein
MEAEKSKNEGVGQSIIRWTSLVAQKGKDEKQKALAG